LTRCGGFPPSVSLHPVEEWGIEQIVLENSHGALDDDQVLRVTLYVHVHFEDGETALLEWTTWRYAYHAGPLVVGGGSGPPWELSVVDVEQLPRG
jgi:hypothetical protein